MPIEIRVAFEFGPGPVNLWIETPLGASKWTAAYRVALTGPKRLPVIAELRVFPTGRTRKSTPAGKWSAETKGIAATVPDAGLQAATLKEIRLSRVLRQLDDAVARAAAEHPEFVVRWPMWQGQPLGRSLARTSSERGHGRGRPPLADWVLAEIATEYVDALRRVHENPIRYIAQRRGEGPNTVRGWVFRAREKGFLIGKRERGKASGTLSPLAKMVLQERARRVNASKRQPKGDRR